MEDDNDCCQEIIFTSKKTDLEIVQGSKTAHIASEYYRVWSVC